MRGKFKMKKFIKKIRAELAWIFSKKVLQAINDGASYEEVEQIVETLSNGNRGEKEA